MKSSFRLELENLLKTIVDAEKLLVVINLAIHPSGLIIEQIGRILFHRGVLNYCVIRRSVKALFSDNFPYAYKLGRNWEGIDVYLLDLAKHRFRCHVKRTVLDINRGNALDRMETVQKLLQNGSVDMHIPRAHYTRKNTGLGLAPAYEWDSLVLVVPKSDQLNLSNIMLQPFSGEVWTLICGYFLIKRCIKLLSFLTRGCSKLRAVTSAYRLPNSFRTVTSVGVELVSFLLIEAYLAKITEFLLYSQFKQDPQTLAEFFRSDILVVIPQYMDALVATFEPPEVAQKLMAKMVRPSEFSQMPAGCCARIHTLHRAEYIIRTRKYWNVDVGRRQLYILPGSLKTIPMSYLLGSNIAFKNSFEQFLLRAHESGMMSQFINTHRDKTTVPHPGIPASLTNGGVVVDATVAQSQVYVPVERSERSQGGQPFLRLDRQLRAVKNVEPHQTPAVSHDMFDRKVRDRLAALEVEQPEPSQIAAQIEDRVVADTLAGVDEHVLQQWALAHHRLDARLGDVQPSQVDLFQQRKAQRHQRLIRQVPAVAEIQIAQLAQVRDRVESYPLERHHDGVEHVPVEEIVADVERTLEVQVLQALQVRQKRKVQVHDARDAQLDAFQLRQEGTEGTQKLLVRREEVVQVEVHDRRLGVGQIEYVALLQLLSVIASSVERSCATKCSNCSPPCSKDENVSLSVLRLGPICLKAQNSSSYTKDERKVSECSRSMRKSSGTLARLWLLNLVDLIVSERRVPRVLRIILISVSTSYSVHSLSVSSTT
uniref:Uncharacterized protein n=1 Tax=Anopheles atroparvus TaxID=41427 RepID=A0A182JML5_ANOAO